MGNMEGPLGNATPTTSWHQLHGWKSPRWIVIRIEALTVVAIIFSFWLAAFGSCRRWSNSWIVQKGFFAAQVLSLSLGTYSIGLMQSSSVKSEMYPLWTVSLFTLFGCIDPVTTYNGLDYKGPLSKVVYGICLNFGYVLLMSISTISSVVVKAAIITLSAITFIKGFHRSFALVQQNRMRDMVHVLDFAHGEADVIRKDESLGPSDTRYMTLVHLETAGVVMSEVELAIKNNKDERLRSCYDVCVALCLSHKLQRHILGLDYRLPFPETLMGIDYKWAMKVIEIELAFVYDAFFTGNPFFHHYQAKTTCLSALASLSGICFVLVAVATTIPGAMTRRSGASGFNEVVGTTTADLAITFGILVSLALLELTQLVRSWTSNWARAAVAFAYSRKATNNGLVRNVLEKHKNEELVRNSLEQLRRHMELGGWMRLKVFVATCTNWFDKYLWQDKISQYSILPEARSLTVGKIKGDQLRHYLSKWIPRRCVHLVRTLGLHYMGQVIWELLSSDTNKRGSVKLDEDVKGSVIEFLGQIQSDRLDKNWLLSLPEELEIRHFLPHVSDPRLLNPEVHCYRYTTCVMTWHMVTWYCELEEQQKKRQEERKGYGKKTADCCSYYWRKAAAVIPRPCYYFQRRRRGGGGGGRTKTRDHRRVANALSMYCAYLVKSAPELLPGPVASTKRVYDRFVSEVARIGASDIGTILGDMPDEIVLRNWDANDMQLVDILNPRFRSAGAMAKLLMRRPDTCWKTLALVWVQLLVYAAPYGNVEVHMRRLSQGGEFITHLWALLYHLDIRQWKVQRNLTEITTREDAKRVLTESENGQVVVAYLNSTYDFNHDELASASLLEDGVRYYYTSNLSVARVFGIERNERPALVLTKEGVRYYYTSNPFTFYDGNFRAYDIARFVNANKIALASDQAQAQSSEDNGGQSEAGIEKEIQPLP